MDGQGLGLRDPPRLGKWAGGWVPPGPLIWSWDLEALSQLSQWQVTDKVSAGLSGSGWPSAGPVWL